MRVAGYILCQKHDIFEAHTKCMVMFWSVLQVHRDRTSYAIAYMVYDGKHQENRGGSVDGCDGSLFSCALYHGESD